jgi:hypothetical protein
MRNRDLIDAVIQAKSRLMWREYAILRNSLVNSHMLGIDVAKTDRLMELHLKLYGAKMDLSNLGK